MHTQDTAVAGRVKRGMTLVDRVKRCGDLFIVAGNGGSYTVCLDNVNGETCECKDWRRHLERDGFGHICKHIVAATIANARS